jgi:hypothetical protein
MPQPPRRVELQPATILLGVDHEHPTEAEGQVIKVGAAARDGQVMQDHPPVSLQGGQQPGGTPLPGRTLSPGDGVRAGLEPQPPAGRHSRERANDQSQPGRQQAAKQPAGGADAKGGGGPPGEGPGPGGPLGRPQPPPSGVGGATWAAHAGPDPHRHHRPIADGAGQQPIGSSLRWARMAWRSAWRSGRTDPLGRSSSSKGQGRELAIGVLLSAAC